MGGSASYETPTMISEIEHISVDFLDFLDVKNRFHAFFVHKMERKANRRLKDSEKKWICQTKKDHPGLSNPRIAQKSQK